jgi:hypothetical protein
MKNELTIQDELTDFLLYNTPNGDIKVETLLHNETIWLPQKKIAELFNVDRSVISKHLKNIFDSQELNKELVCAKFAHTTQHGAIKEKTQNISLEYYNLDAVLSVGYRVNSHQATQFRQWATKTLKEYIIKGFAIDDERLKNGQHFGKDYFKELLERVRSIRTSERRIYQQITDIFSECCIDYDNTSAITKNFYAGVQNKFHYAITGQTAAEIVNTHVDKNLPNAGLQTWKNAPDGRILKSDVVVAKNYLKEDEIKKLERTIASYFDYIENQIEQRKELTMESFSQSVDKFLNFNDFKILDGFGHISRQKAKEKAYLEYDEFNKTQKINSDFDKTIKQLKK